MLIIVGILDAILQKKNEPPRSFISPKFLFNSKLHTCVAHIYVEIREFI